ncbi:MAG: DUF2911 domain-containing protein [Bacteroidetes bacterium]|nr:DUF2911 domain-containing protein [Bacteroidota bacterium]MBS1541412.1 DUF2911 domain-containing protein [Bacteroidota bacterium]
MKKQISILTLAVVTLMATAAFAQKGDKSKRPSPAAKAAGTIDGAKIDIEYSSPSVKGRKIFGGLEPYGKVWRTGANEATTFTVDKDIKIEGKTLAKGTYALFTIPNENEWTVIFNKNAKQWGAFDYKESEDALRVMVKPGKTAALVEKLSIAIEGSKVVIRWENTEVAFAVK